MRCEKDKMIKLGYTSAQCDYYCYVLEEEVSLGDLDVPQLIAERKREKGGERADGSLGCHCVGKSWGWGVSGSCGVVGVESWSWRVEGSIVESLNR